MVNHQAYAKVNLGLSIVAKRPDGYHEIETLMVTIDLFDIVQVKERSQGIEIVCPELVLVPQTDNIAYKAADCFLSEHGTKPDRGFGIHITKNIPVGGGLGGGSSDAAAVLLALQELMFGSFLGSIDHLVQIGARVGSDVAFFVGANSNPPQWHSALCSGRGEHIERIDGGEFWLVTVVPENRIATKWAYDQWDAVNTLGVFSSEGSACKDYGLTGGLGDKDRRMDRLLEAFSSGDPEFLGRAIFNDLEMPVCRSHPLISSIKEGLVSSGAYGACMTGSGSAVYGVCDSLEHSLAVKERFLAVFPHEAGICDVIITKTRR
jgi:4-diphosphocytidyl-2-C-methyl-D-erythritol kinase